MILKRALVFEGVRQWFSPFCSRGSIMLSTGGTDLFGNTLNVAFIILFFLSDLSQIARERFTDKPKTFTA